MPVIDRSARFLAYQHRRYGPLGLAPGALPLVREAQDRDHARLPSRQRQQGVRDVGSVHDEALSGREVEAYPAAKFEAMAAEQVPSRFEGDQSERRLFFQTAAEVELKGPGRITLPQRLLPYFPAGEVRIAGMNDYLELWDPATWDRHVVQAAGAFPLPGGPGQGGEDRG